MNLDIIFSEKCSLSCSYCPYQQNQDNAHVRAQLANGSFAAVAVKAIEEYHIDSLALRGLEPAVNFDQFPAFIKTILSAKQQIESISIYTHGSQQLYKYFVEPIIKNDININFYFLIDGPETNEKTKGAYNYARKSIVNLIRACPSKVNNEFKLYLHTESVITKFELRQDPAEWYAWAESFKEGFVNSAASKSYIDATGLGAPPILEVPGRYFPRDAAAFKTWFKKIKPSCSASLTIDCDGKLYGCYLKRNKIGFNAQLLRSNVDKRVDFLLKQKQIMRTDKDALFEDIMSIWCWATAPDINTIDDSYIMLLGNI